MTGWTTNPFRELATGQLLRERECRAWDLADLDAHPDGWAFAPESRVFLVATIDALEAELARRRAVRDRPGAPRWPDERERRGELAEIKRRVTVIDLIHSEVWREYERRGPHDVWCCCPLPGHDEQTPSFHIDEARQVWHCFGCGRGGDVFELGRQLWGEALFFRVVDRLRGVAGLERPKPAPAPGVLVPGRRAVIVR